MVKYKVDTNKSNPLTCKQLECYWVKSGSLLLKTLISILRCIVTSFIPSLQTLLSDADYGESLTVWVTLADDRTESHTYYLGSGQQLLTGRRKGGLKLWKMLGFLFFFFPYLCEFSVPFSETFLTTLWEPSLRWPTESLTRGWIQKLNFSFCEEETKLRAEDSKETLRQRYMKYEDEDYGDPGTSRFQFQTLLNAWRHQFYTARASSVSRDNPSPPKGAEPTRDFFNKMISAQSSTHWDSCPLALIRRPLWLPLISIHSLQSLIEQYSLNQRARGNLELAWGNCRRRRQIRMWLPAKESVLQNTNMAPCYEKEFLEV